MQIRDFLTDDDTVNPVITVILMVAITVILAAFVWDWEMRVRLPHRYRSITTTLIAMAPRQIHWW